MNETKPQTGMPDGGIHMNDLCSSHRLTRNMKEEERRMFIDYMFEHVETSEKLSKKSMAKRLSDMFKEGHPELKLNEVWVYRLLLAGIYKDKNGNYGFDNIECDFDESCKKPSLLIKALDEQKKQNQTC